MTLLRRISFANILRALVVAVAILDPKNIFFVSGFSRPTSIHRFKVSSMTAAAMPVTSSGAGESSGKVRAVGKSWQILERSHERGIFLFYALASTGVLLAAGKQSQSLLVAAETGVVLTWATMIMSISFLEAWVKFKAPFLKKYIAVDVGRHVFAALNAAELALSGSFWVSRVVQCWRLREATGFFTRDKAYYSQPGFLLPAIATIALLVELTLVSPQLFLRAKARIVEGFRIMPASLRKTVLNETEQRELDDISREVDDRRHSMPSPKWHSAYAILELLKVICLQAFAVLTLMKTTV